MGPAELHVSVVFSPRAGEVDAVDLLLPAGATVADALAASGMQARHPGHDLAALPVGLWGAFCERSDPLRDRDRVELYRPLRVDPKEARRQRQQAQRAVRRRA
jgi:putative ubiquitin-RnfH superfamily antitoxin RatB of RatAB toxin-antitoxin module